MNRLENIFLIGPMGAGKTTVGRSLARKLNIDFYDSDREIESNCGVSIATIFEYEGEAGFRKREAKILEGLSKRSPIILATGGGSILRKENRNLLSKRGIVVYLKIDLKEQFSRISHDKTRPLLQTENPKKMLEALMLERGPIYDSLADLTVNSNGRNMRYVIEKITKFMKNQ